MKKTMIGISILLVLTLILPINVAMSIQKRTLYVDDDGGADYKTIQEAIDAANSGDMIYVYSGMYNENLRIDKSLVLQGENKESTIIDGGNVDSVIQIDADEVTISTFTIRNGKNSSKEAGIFIRSDNNIISDNIITRNLGYGIYSENTHGHQIVGNKISKNNYDGISLISSRDDIINNNTIIDHFYKVYSIGPIPRSHGVWLYNVTSSSVVNNYFSDNINSDLSIQYCIEISVENNVFFGGSGLFISGIRHQELDSHRINDNYVNGKPLYYYKNNHDGGIIPNDAGQVILVDCKNFIIENLDVDGGDYAVILWYSSNNTIKNNKITNVLDGIYLLYSDHNIITFNDISHVWGNPLQTSNNNYFAFNKIQNNTRYGTGLFYASNDNTFYHNTIYNCTENGIIISQSDGNRISLNSIHNNPLSGIDVIKSDNNMISGNTLKNNVEYGVKIEYLSSNNHIHHNNLISNRKDNAINSGQNLWDLDVLGGNYWDDYIGSDNNGDGFGDKPYIIKGGKTDNFPYIKPISISYPAKPDKPVGPSTGKTKKEIFFNFCGYDPENLKIYYFVDWNDGSTEEWMGPFNSGETIELSHIWQNKGSYNIKVKTCNIIGAESEWSDPLSVSMPKTLFSHKINFWGLFDRIVDCFPFINSLFR